jgi:hypothetical protein
VSSLWGLPRAGRSVPQMRHLNGRTRPVLRLGSKLRAAACGIVVAAGLANTVPATAAAPRGTLKGRVVNETTKEPQGGVALRLISAGPDGVGRAVTRAVSDAAGRYLFDNLPTGKARTYALQARFRGGLFAGAPLRLPGGTPSPPVVVSRLRVWNTTTDPRAIRVARDDLFVVPAEDHVGVIESIKVVNATDRAYVGRGQAMGVEGSGGSPSLSLGFSLPQTADRNSVVIGDTDLTGPPPVTTEFGFAATVAVPPGETATTFSYRVEGNGGVFDLSRTALYPTQEMSVYATDPLEVEGNRLVRRGSKAIGGVEYRIWATGDGVAAGDSVQVLATAEAGAAPGLIMGLSASLTFVSGLGLLALWRRRNRSRPAARPSREAASDAPGPAAVAAGPPRSPSRKGPSRPRRGGETEDGPGSRVNVPLSTGDGGDKDSAAGAAPGAEGGVGRPAIIDAIAALDIDLENGEITKEEWLERRASLKELLASTSSEPPP